MSLEMSSEIAPTLIGGVAALLMASYFVVRSMTARKAERRVRVRVDERRR